jgi:hypothetical protein
MLLAEEFALMALDPDGSLRRGILTQWAAEVGVTGALIIELAQNGHINISDGRIHLTGTRPADPLLAQVLTNLAPHEGRKLTSRLESVKHAGWREVVDNMVKAGIVRREKHGLHTTRHPVADPGAQATLVARVRSAAHDDTDLDPRMAALLALAGTCQLLEVVAPERDERKHAKRRIAEAAAQVPGIDAVEHRVTELRVAMTSGAATVRV